MTPSMFWTEWSSFSSSGTLRPESWKEEGLLWSEIWRLLSAHLIPLGQSGPWASSCTTWCAVTSHSRKTSRFATQSLPSEDLSAQNAKISSDHVWESGRKTGLHWTLYCSIAGSWWTHQMKHILMGENQPYPQVFCYQEALISHPHLRNLYNQTIKYFLWNCSTSKSKALFHFLEFECKHYLPRYQLS
jgi:hypothetical protein